MVFQSYALYPRMTVRENLSFGLRMARHAAGRDRASGSRARPRCCRSSHLLDRRPDAALGRPAPARRDRPGAGARRRRLPVRRAAVQPRRPAPRTSSGSRSSACTSGSANTMIYVTHDQIEALTLADRIAVMKGGVIQQLGAPARRSTTGPANRFVAGFVGSPRMNFIEGRLERADGGLGLRRRRAPAAARRLSASRRGRRPGGRSRWACGPSISRIGGAGGGRWHGFAVDIVEPMGADNLVWCGDGRLSLERPHLRRAAAPAGRALDARPRPSAASRCSPPSSGARL